MIITCPNCGHSAKTKLQNIAVSTRIRCKKCQQPFLYGDGRSFFDMDNQSTYQDSPLGEPPDPPQPMSPMPSQTVEQEPWYYAYLESYGKAIKKFAEMFFKLFYLYLGIATIGMGFVLFRAVKTVANIISALGWESVPEYLNALLFFWLSQCAFWVGTLALVYVVLAFIKHSLLILAAQILLCVDAARNIRRTRLASEG